MYGENHNRSLTESDVWHSSSVKSRSLDWITMLPGQHLRVQSQQWTYQSKVWNLLQVNNDVFLVSLLLLNGFHILFWCFFRWIWTSKCRLGWHQLYSLCQFSNLHNGKTNCFYHNPRNKKWGLEEDWSGICVRNKVSTGELGIERCWSEWVVIF